MNYIHRVLWAIESTWHHGSGDGYLFVSGIAPNFAYLTIILVGYRFWLTHTCHVKGCWRHGWNNNGTYLLCKKHFPGDPPAAADIALEEIP